MYVADTQPKLVTKLGWFSVEIIVLSQSLERKWACNLEKFVSKLKIVNMSVCTINVYSLWPADATINSALHCDNLV